MPLPAGVDVVTITGTLYNPDGTPASGSIDFAPSVCVLHVDEQVIILPAKVTAVLVDGAFPAGFKLPAMNDTGANPQGATLHVTERITGGRSFDVYLAKSPITVDYSVLSPVPTSSGVPVVVGPAGPAMTNATLLTEGTLADARLTTRLSTVSLAAAHAATTAIAAADATAKVAAEAAIARAAEAAIDVATIGAITPAGVDTKIVAERTPAGVVVDGKIATERTTERALQSSTYLTPQIAPNVGNFTGRLRGSGGTGTDARPLIQAALDAASQSAGAYWYSYLERKSVKVTLPPGRYLLSAPSDGTASLKVPQGVTLDCSSAQLFFDYPAAPTGAWCGIELANYANLIVGTLAPSKNNAAPDARYLYDGVRIVMSDNVGTRVTGSGDAQIDGFQGASIRGVGSWIVYISGIRFTSAYGYIASALPVTNVYGYVLPADLPNRANRGTTDTFIDDCYFNGNKMGGFIGPVTGAPGTGTEWTALAYATYGSLQLYITNSVFEFFASPAIYATGYTMSLTDCAFEDVGNGTSMALFDQVRSLAVRNLRVNYAGSTVQGPSGPVVPNPPLVFKFVNVSAFALDNAYIWNAFNPTMRLADVAAKGYSVKGVVTESLPLVAGPMYNHQFGRHDGGVWNLGHQVINGRHLWVDASDVIRAKGSLPTTDTDGAPLSGSGDVLASGQSTIDRRTASNLITMATGVVRFTYFTSQKTETVNNLRLVTGTTAAAATPTLVRAGLFSVAANGDLTLLSAITSDTAIFATALASYTRALAAGVPMVAGSRYAIGVLVVTAAAAPTVYGVSALTGAEASMAPCLVGSLLAQADLPGSATFASLTAGTSLVYAAMTP